MYDDTSVEAWFNQTTLHPIAVVALLMLGAATLVVPRRYALVPALILACFVAPAQRIVLTTLDFNFLRLIVLFGWARVLLRGETTAFRWRTLDTAVIAWVICATVTATLLNATTAAFINRLGILYDAIGIYFLCRFLVRDWEDVHAFARSAALISLPVTVAFLIEKATGRNMFAVFGGVPEITIVRAGRLRCQGPFAHSILAGTFWAVLMPLIGALWWRRGWNRILAVAGLAASTVIVIACGSATPIGAMLFGIAAAALFPLRRWLRWVRWSAVVGLIGLQLVMINPVWHLLARVPLVTGASGWYRFKLIDEFLRHFHEWWLVGTNSYAGWSPLGFEAITNQYVLQGVQGGLLTLAIFLAIIAVAFHGVGQIGRRADRRRYRLVQSAKRAGGHALETIPTSAAHVAMAWALGVALFVHCVAFIGVSYFGQVILVWYLALGFIGSLTPPRRRGQTVLAWRPRRDAAAGVPTGPSLPIVPVAGV
ncbi:MAG: hypothetical protein ACYS0G_13105 [Planctomycetota bacterium]|jgi:hypothetical protein